MTFSELFFPDHLEIINYWIGAKWTIRSILSGSICLFFFPHLGIYPRVVIVLDLLYPMPALAPVGMVPLRELARTWIQQNPLASIQDLARARRIYDKGARAAFVVKAYQAKPAAGSEPCCLCGTYTFAYCETCPLYSESCPPAPLCSECDEDKMVCQTCKADHASWEQERMKHTAKGGEETIEIAGVTLDNGVFERFKAPLKIPVSKVKRTRDGEVDYDQLMILIQDHVNKTAAASGRPSAPSHP